MVKKTPQTNHQKKKKNNSQGRSGLNDYLKYAGMGVQMLVIIAVFTWAGSRLDQRAAIEKPIYTAVLSLLGVIIAIYTVLKDFIHKDDA